MINDKIQKTSDIVKLQNNDLIGDSSNIFDLFLNKTSEKIDFNNKSLINFLMQVPAFKQFLESVPKFSKRFEVVISKDVIEKIKKKQYEFINTGNENEYFAFLRDSKTKKFIKQLKLKEISEIQNLPEHLQAASNVAIMQMLNQISLQLKSIEQKLILIHKEFNNDRIGKLQAGYSLYLDSKQMMNNDNKRLALINSVGLYIEGRAQLIESLKSRLENTEASVWKTFFKEISSLNHKKFQEENIRELLKEFFYIQRASQLILLVYLELEELNSATQSLSPLRNILEDINKEQEISKIIEWDTSENDWQNSFKIMLEQFNKIDAFNETGNDSEITIEIKK